MNVDHGPIRWIALVAGKLWPRSSIRAKGAAIVAVPAGVLLLLVIRVTGVQHQAELASEWVANTAQVLKSGNTVLGAVLGMESAVQGYVVTGKPEYKKRYENFQQIANEGLQRIRLGVADNPEQQKRCASIMALVEQEERWLDAEMLARVNTSVDQLVLTTLVERGRVQGDQIIRDLSEFLSEEGRRMDVRNRALAARMAAVRVIFRGLSAIGIAGGLLASWLFAVLIVRRLQLLEEKAMLLAQGLPVPAPESGDDEIGRLDQALHTAAGLIAEREGKLEEALQAAEKATRAKSEFLAAMSHEIRTPMNTILGVADILWETPLNPEQTEYVRMFRQAGESLLTLINDILDLSKVEAGVLRLDTVEFDLNDVLDRVVEVTIARARSKGLELTCRVGPDAAGGYLGDPDRLQQILYNVVSNAVKFTERGEVAIQIQVKDAGGDPPTLHFSVSDTGIGVPAEKLDVIFENFTQADASTSRKYGGTGLGLAICRRLVDLMNGRIWMESQLGRGSTVHFTVKLPLARNGATTRDEGIRLDGHRILIVDDNATNRRLVGEILTPSGCTVKEAVDGSEGIAEVQRAAGAGQPFSAVLLDCRMADIDGFEVSRRIRSDPRIAETPIVLLMSETCAGHVTRARDLNIFSYLAKPVRRASLLRVVQTACVRTAHARTSPAEAPAPAKPSFHANILLCEDSADNVRLTQAYLKGTGFRLEIAENGEVAVKKFQTGRYDLVLMDLQMPGTDGYEATSRIRDWENQMGRRRTPILALTAHALMEARQASAAAGCDAHLTKPIRRSTLLDAIRQYCRPSIPPIEVEVPEEIADLVPEYLEQRLADVPRIESALERKDYDAIRILGHNLKGSGGGYGFDGLTELGRGIEESAREQDVNRIRAQLVALSDYLARVQVVQSPR